MKFPSKMIIIVTVMLAMPVSAQITTWEEEFNNAKAAQSQKNLPLAELHYRNALQRFKPSSNDERYSATLLAMLNVLYVQNRLCSAVPVCRSLVQYIQRNASSPQDSTLVNAQQNYKKLLERTITGSRWATVEPIFKQHKFNGMDRTRVHELLGDPQKAGNGTSITSAPISGYGQIRLRISDTPTKDLPEQGLRDFYVMSSLASDPPTVNTAGMNAAALKRLAQQLESMHDHGQPFSWLDIDYVEEHVVKYRARSQDD